VAPTVALLILRVALMILRNFEKNSENPEDNHERGSHHKTPFLGEICCKSELIRALIQKTPDQFLLTFCLNFHFA